MLSLAITDDIGAILVVAIGYSEEVAWPPLARASSRSLHGFTPDA
jgi:NhaA family Na+:H+ antiporter